MQILEMTSEQVLTFEPFLTSEQSIKIFTETAEQLEAKYQGRAVYETNWDPNGENGYAIITDAHDERTQLMAIFQMIRKDPRYKVEGAVFAGDLSHKESGQPLSIRDRLEMISLPLQIISRSTNNVNAVAGNHDVCAAGKPDDKVQVSKTGVNQSEEFYNELVAFGGIILAKQVQRCFDALPLVVITRILNGKLIEKIITTHSIPFNKGEPLNITLQELINYNPAEIRAGKQENLRRWIFAQPRMTTREYSDLEQRKIARQNEVNRMCRLFGSEPSKTLWVFGHTAMPEEEIDLQSIRKTLNNGDCKFFPGYYASAMIEIMLLRSNSQMQKQRALAMELMAFGGPYSRTDVNTPYSTWAREFIMHATSSGNNGINKWNVERLLQEGLQFDPDGQIIIRHSQDVCDGGVGPGLINLGEL